jgi:hypothetical protein
MNAKQRAAIDGYFTQALALVLPRTDWGELRIALKATDPDSTELCNLMARYNRNEMLTNFLRNILVGVRKLSMGRDVELHVRIDQFAIVPLERVPFSLDKHGHITRETISEYSNSILDAARPIHPISLDSIEDPEIPMESIRSDLLMRLLHGVGRGVGRVVWRPVDAILNPIRTIRGFFTFLYRLATDPVELCGGMYEAAVQYWRDDPIAFCTEVFLNGILLAYTFHHTSGPASGVNNVATPMKDATTAVDLLSRRVGFEASMPVPRYAGFVGSPMPGFVGSPMVLAKSMDSVAQSIGSAMAVAQSTNTTRSVADAMSVVNAVGDVAALGMSTKLCSGEEDHDFPRHVLVKTALAKAHAKLAECPAEGESVREVVVPAEFVIDVFADPIIKYAEGVIRKEKEAFAIDLFADPEVIVYAAKAEVCDCAKSVISLDAAVDGAAKKFN